MKNIEGLTGAYRLIITQLAVSMLFSLICFCIFGIVGVVSALAGGLVNIVPNFYFARKVFSCRGAQASRKIVNNFYVGEAIKIILSIALFAVVFMFFTIKPVVFFAAYILTQMVIWFAPLLFVKGIK